MDLSSCSDGIQFDKVSLYVSLKKIVYMGFYSPSIESGPQLKAPAKKRNRLFRMMPQEPVAMNNIRLTPDADTDRAVPKSDLPLKNLQRKLNSETVVSKLCGI